MQFRGYVVQSSTHLHPNECKGEFCTKLSCAMQLNSSVGSVFRGFYSVFIFQLLCLSSLGLVIRLLVAR